jgi:predicted phosphodiesterase
MDKLKLRYISDIHLEFIKPNEIINFLNNITQSDKDEVCILAGDIGNPYSQNYKIFIDHISKIFQKTFIIAGNHEFYNNKKTIEETYEFLTEYFKQYDNITFLNNSYEIYNSYTFIGTTLWSKVTNPAYEINDVHSIANLNYIKYNQLNAISRAYLDEQIKLHDNVIMITHHMPSSSLIDAKYKQYGMNHYNQWFYCDMDKFIEENKDKLKCWIYGHTHTPNFKMIHEIPFMCNSIGYPNENNKNDFNKIFYL